MTTNRLARESSPYLLQHAHNPVDWWPWCDDAFAEARRRDVPVFLSVGYATCYWCHVMERESFEHAPTADLMNRSFVCVKVDREERPDVDDLYMAATVMMSGRGGWPMSCFLEPQRRRPFWCGTYFPREPRPGMPTFERVLTAMGRAWGTDRAGVLDQADRLAQGVGAELGSTPQPAGLGRAQVEGAVRALLGAFDRRSGGFGGAPKFPQAVYLELLLDARAGADDATRAALDLVLRTTLDAMLTGGIHDQVGGGFHRYSVDGAWTVPHFEKMLYDTAQLVSVYARAGEAYDEQEYRRVARRACAWALREMRAPGAPGFFSALDAEVDGREGLNYLWTPGEVFAALGEGDGAFAVGVYGLDADANFRDPHRPSDPASWVLRLRDRPDRLARASGADPTAFVARLDLINGRLREVRDRRPRPRVDDKVIAGWNGLMIGALASASTALGDPGLRRAASDAAVFVRATLMGAGGVLGRTARAGVLGPAAVLEDHAFLARGLLALDRAAPGGDADALGAARSLVEAALERFGDGAGGYFDVAADRADLFVRPRSTHDGALPSGVGAMIGAMVDLGERTGERAWLDRGAAALASIGAAVARNPVGATESVRHLLRLIRLGIINADAGAPGSPQPGVVRVFADNEEVTVSPGAPGVVRVALEIAEGYHVAAAEAFAPGEEALGGVTPLRVGLVSGSGVAVYADYPAGEPDASGLLAHRGRVELVVALEWAEGVGVGPGEPVLGVTFQPCRDDACLEAVTVALRVRVVLRGEGGA